MNRRKTREVKIGSCIIGCDNPIAVQSMTNTKTENVEETVKQIEDLVNAGCEIVRVAVPNRSALSALNVIKNKIGVPLVADIHFQPEYALRCIKTKVDKIRINPGNLGGFENFKKVVNELKSTDKALRIGVNSGSVEKDLLEKYGYPSTEAMVESAIRYVEICDELKFHNFVVSIKSSDVKVNLEANKMFAQKTDVPLHIGVTEAGDKNYGSIKSSIGIGSLLLEGIGDTIRVSLLGNPVDEIKVAYNILKATGRRITSPEIIACPTCGRIEIDLEKVVKEVEERLEKEGIKTPVKISILGCVVNGPGEAQEADIGIAGGRGKGILFRNGKMLRIVKESEMVNALIEELKKIK